MKKVDELTRVQEIVFDQLNRLDKKDLITIGLSKKEFERSKAIATNAQTYIKVVNLKLKIKELSKKDSNLINELNIGE